MEGALVWVVDGLMVLGVALLGISVFGMLWMPDLYTRLHAASKGCFVGTSLIVLAALVTGGPGVTSRCLLILLFLVLTNPLSSHAIGRAAWLAREPTEPPDLLDESGRLEERREEVSPGAPHGRPAGRDVEPV
jgi:multicomponent Na+:H+ antiporter subunit G